MLAVDRARYCHESDPYLDRPRRIGYNVTISAPHMVSAILLSILITKITNYRYLYIRVDLSYSW